MSYIRVFQAELLKYKSWATWVWIFLPIFLCLLVWWQMNGLVARDPDRNTWSLFIQIIAAFWGVFLFPPFLIFWSSQSICQESSMWKLTFCQGQSRTSLLLGKFSVLVFWVFLQLVVLISCAAVIGNQLNLQGDLPSHRFMWFLGCTVFTMPILGWQLCLGAYVPRFYAIVLAGLGAHFVCILAVQVYLGRFLPWAFVLEALQIRGTDHHLTLLQGIICLAQTGLFLIIGARKLESKQV